MLAIIGVIAASVILPALMGGILWWLIPQSVKDLITEIINLGIMLLDDVADEHPDEAHVKFRQSQTKESKAREDREN